MYLIINTIAIIIYRYVHQKWSYAFPLEIIYLTPLSKWNPYNIDFKGNAKGVAKIVEANGRNGDLEDKAKAYNGTHSRKFYMTPVEFFSGNEVGIDLADTTKNSVGVLNKYGRCLSRWNIPEHSVLKA